MSQDAGRVDRQVPRGESDVEHKQRRGIWRIRTELGAPPRRGLRSGILFALSSALVLGTAAGLALADVIEPRERVLAIMMAGQWFLAAADVLPIRMRAGATAKRILGLALLIGGGVGGWTV